MPAKDVALYKGSIELYIVAVKACVSGLSLEEEEGWSQSEKLWYEDEYIANRYTP